MILRMVFPVYNESLLIESVVKEWCFVKEKVLDADVQLYFYNDGSKDNTLEILNTLKNNYPITIIDKKNSGHGSTILQAYNDACSDNADWVFQADSDRDMEPTCFLNLWEKRGSFDFLIGYRSHRKQNIIRFFITRVSRILIALLFGNKVRDVNSPFRLMRVSVFRDAFKIIPKDTFAPNLLISSYVNIKNINILQVPVPHKELKKESLKGSIKMFSKAIKCVKELYYFKKIITRKKNV